jgi:hypothetical protein
MLVYEPGETFFWGEDLWRAANDGGQRMDSSRYWNTIRSVDDWQRTRDLWDVARVEAASFHDGDYQYVRGNATNAYAASKLSLFTRQLLYLPSRGVLAVFDRVRTPRPDLKKVWLLHGVSRPRVESPQAGNDVGHGGTSYGAATTIAWEDGEGSLRVHPLLPRARDVTIRGGDGWEFWTPGDEHDGAWGSGRNWPLEPWEGGALPDDPYLVRMWKTFWGDEFTRLARSNKNGVVHPPTIGSCTSSKSATAASRAPGAWRRWMARYCPARSSTISSCSSRAATRQPPTARSRCLQPTSASSSSPACGPTSRTNCSGRPSGFRRAG